MDTVAPDQLFGYNVIDDAQNKVGSVDGVWVDDATNQLEFVAVKTGMLFGKNHMIPVQSAQIDSGNQTITVPYSQDQINDAPNFDSGDELSPEDEDTIYSYYGMDRSTAPSPSGLPTQSTAGEYAASGITGTDDTLDTAAVGDGTSTNFGTDEQRIQLAEEELAVGTRQVQAGQVRLRKVVRTEQVEQPVELRREEIDIERVPVSDFNDTTTDVGSSAFQEQEIEVPVMREEPVVEKQARVTGEVRVGKDVETETRTVSGEVRKEDIEVDGEDGVDFQRPPRTS